MTFLLESLLESLLAAPALLLPFLLPIGLKIDTSRKCCVKTTLDFWAQVRYTTNMKKAINELKTWNWGAIAALAFCWGIEFYNVL